MAEKKESKKSTKNILESIREGMRVYDREGRDLGKVDRVHTGPAGSEAGYAYRGPRAGKEAGDGETLFAKWVEEMLDPMDNLHKELQEELYLHGFMRMLSEGLEGKERYILPDQIHSVSGEAVHLHASQEELKK
jgi:hypothetical protein